MVDKLKAVRNIVLFFVFTLGALMALSALGKFLVH